jgi:uncharacterized protein with HEPN domain
LRGDRVRLADILDRIDRILAHTDTRSRPPTRSSWDLDAVERNLEMVGEAAKAMTPALRSRYSEIPWKEMIGFRVLATDVNWEVEPERLWVIVRALPLLRRRLARISTSD